MVEKTFILKIFDAKELFDTQKYFKLICGAGNEDLEEVKEGFLWFIP